MVEERAGEVYAGILGLGGVAEGQLRSWPLQQRPERRRSCRVWAPSGVCGGRNGERRAGGLGACTTGEVWVAWQRANSEVGPTTAARTTPILPGLDSEW